MGKPRLLENVLSRPQGGLGECEEELVKIPGAQGPGCCGGRMEVLANGIWTQTHKDILIDIHLF